MEEVSLLRLKKERDKLLNAWIEANAEDKTAILVKISDIDDELERRERMQD